MSNGVETQKWVSEAKIERSSQERKSRLVYLYLGLAIMTPLHSTAVCFPSVHFI